MGTFTISITLVLHKWYKTMVNIERQYNCFPSWWWGIVNTAFAIYYNCIFRDRWLTERSTIMRHMSLLLGYADNASVKQSCRGQHRSLGPSAVCWRSLMRIAPITECYTVISTCHLPPLLVNSPNPRQIISSPTCNWLRHFCWKTLIVKI